MVSTEKYKKCDLVYAAGLFDREGSIILFTNGTKLKGKDFSFRSLRCSITSTSKELLNFMLNTFGGKIYSRKVYNKNYMKKWEWIISAKDSQQFLKLILPYLKEKEKIRKTRLIINRYKKYTKKQYFVRYTNKEINEKLGFEKEFFKNSRKPTIINDLKTGIYKGV